MADPFDEDADLRATLAELGPAALEDLRGILEEPESYRDATMRALAFGHYPSDLATLIAMADTDETIRLRLLRAIRHLDEEGAQEDRPRVRVTFDVALPLLAHEIFEAIEQEGFQPVLGESPTEERGGREVFGLLTVGVALQIIGALKVGTDVADIAARLVEAVKSAVRRRRPKKTEIEVNIYGPKGEVLKRVKIETDDPDEGSAR
jgi:hypothetical protein